MPSSRIAILLVLSLAAPIARAAGNHSPTYHPHKGSEILWDRYGVPHVFAKSIPDMFFCFGYAQAEAHGDLLLHVLGGSRGRGAEYFGPGEADANLKTDRWIWTNEVPMRAVQWLAVQTPEFRSYLDAFAAGINAYAAAHPAALAPEVKQVLPITALDLIEHEQHFYNFEFVAGRTLANPPQAAAQETALSSPPELPPGSFDNNTPEDLADGSNGWAIAPSHTADGKAMMLLNPHLAWGGEQTYFEVHLTAPGVDLYGATQIGVPFLRFVFSNYVAITNTVNTNNGHLLYRIAEADGGYKFDGKLLPYTKASYPIKILRKDGSYVTENVEVLKTVHGPIIRRDNGVPIALYVAGLDKPFMLEQVWKMSTAHTFAEYQAQARRLQIPMYNIMYADRDGHIEYLFNAPVPRRSQGDYAFWSRPVPGDTSSLLPTGSLTYDELPKVIDPPSGYVQNSNQPPWDAAWPTMINPKDYAPYIAPQFPTFRSDRALRMLSEDSKISFDMLLQKKLSTRAEGADRLLPDLFAAVDHYGTPRAKQAAVVLKAWDRQTEANSTGALLFWRWATRFGMPAAAPASTRNFAIPYAIDKPLTTPAGIKDPAAAAAMLDAAAGDVIANFGALDKPWGSYLRLQINAQSAGAASAPHRGPALNGVDLPGNGGPGAIGIFRVVTPGPVQDGISTPVHGDGFTIAVEFSQPIRAKALVSYGECSQPGCSHHTDQLPLFEKKQWRDIWRTRPQIQANLEHKETF
ncbi:MAG TPA: penicillin acylase family protein [Acidobacteriaceae bacterium]